METPRYGAIARQGELRGKLGEELGESLKDSVIVVIDDDEVSRLVFDGFLKKAGFTNITMAHDGKAGLALIEKKRPDIVLLDLDMPVISGVEVLETLRNSPETANLPIIVETSYDTPGERNSAFAAGATDLVTKPINGDELIARIRIHLENRLLVAKLLTERDRVASELAQAREMQERLLPQPKFLAKITGDYDIRIHDHFETSSELGGDIWGVLPIDKDRLAVFLCDFTGHGAGAALNTFRMHSILHNMELSNISPSDCLEALNNRLIEALPRDQFATMVYGIVNFAEHTFEFAGAAAPRPLIKTPTDEDYRELNTRGLPLGISEDTKYMTQKESFPPGSELFLYSDALTETSDEHGDFLSISDIETYLLQSKDADMPLSTLLARFNRRAINGLSDDLTAVWLVRNSS